MEDSSGRPTSSPQRHALPARAAWTRSHTCAAGSRGTRSFCWHTEHLVAFHAHSSLWPMLGDAALTRCGTREPGSRGESHSAWRPPNGSAPNGSAPNRQRDNSIRLRSAPPSLFPARRDVWLAGSRPAYALPKAGHRPGCRWPDTPARARRRANCQAGSECTSFCECAPRARDRGSGKPRRAQAQGARPSSGPPPPVHVRRNRLYGLPLVRPISSSRARACRMSGRCWGRRTGAER